MSAKPETWIDFPFPQGYSPQHEEIVPKMKWETEEVSYPQNYEIPRPKERKTIVEPQRGSRLWM